MTTKFVSLETTPRQLRGRWVTLAVIVLIVASDYDLRSRAPSDALSSSADLGVMLEVFLYGLVGSALLLFRRGLVRLRYPSMELLFLLTWIFLMGLSLLYTPYLQYALVRVGQMVILFLWVLSVREFGARIHLHYLAHAFIILVAVSVPYGIVFPSEPLSRQQIGRFTWLAIHPITAGLFLALAAVLTLVYLIARLQGLEMALLKTPWYGVLLVGLSGALIATQTRGAVFGFAAAAVVVVVGLNVGRNMASTILLIAMIGVIAFLVGDSAISSFFERGGTTEDLASLNSRTDLWSLALEAAKARPMYGYGVTATQGMFYEETGLGGGHNAFVNVLVELGVVGLITWLALCVSILRSSVQLLVLKQDAVRMDVVIVWSVMVLLLVDGIFFEGPGAVTNVGSTWIFICVAWLSVVKREQAVGLYV